MSEHPARCDCVARTPRNPEQGGASLLCYTQTLIDPEGPETTRARASESRHCFLRSRVRNGRGLNHS
jgi:hypothetical protein